MQNGSAGTGGNKNAVCNTCTLRLVEIAYRRKPSFRLFREPFRLGMRFFSIVYRIDPDEYEVRTPQCRGCVRFHKLALKDRLPMFHRLNSFFNPMFDRQLEKIVSTEEVLEAREHARWSMFGPSIRSTRIDSTTEDPSPSKPFRDDI
jgi:hypothetical protein